MFSKDVVEDFMKDFVKLRMNWIRKELKSITKSFGKVASRMVKERISGND